jgi:hypothetical protein
MLANYFGFINPTQKADAAWKRIWPERTWPGSSFAALVGLKSIETRKGSRPRKRVGSLFRDAPCLPSAPSPPATSPLMSRTDASAGSSCSRSRRTTPNLRTFSQRLMLRRLAYTHELFPCLPADPVGVPLRPLGRLVQLLHVSTESPQLDSFAHQ